MIRRYDMIVRVDESSSGYYVSFDDHAHLLPRKGNDLPEDEGRCLVRGQFAGALSVWVHAWRQADGSWIRLEDTRPIDLSRVTHWMRVPEVET